MSEYGFLVKKQSTKQVALYEQVIKLTKENQYLHTRVKALTQQIESIFRGKEKYKSKYKNIKQYMSAKPIDTCQTMRTNEEIRALSLGKSYSNTQKHISTQKSVEKEDRNKTQTENLEQTISKINQNIEVISTRLQALIKTVQNHQNAALLRKITDVGQTLNSIAIKLKNNERKREKNEPHSQMLLSESPNNQKVKKNELRINSIGRFTESKSQKSFIKQFKLQQKKKSESKRQKNENKAKRYEEDSLQENRQKVRNWNVLKQIGQELQNWKFPLSDQD